MLNNQIKTMRDAFIEKVYQRMKRDPSIFFLSADLGAPALDKLRKDFKDRFLNVGIAEPDLINISTGLALEGYTVFAYAISPFLTMRAYEQIRQNISISSTIKPVNVNLIGIGTGLSYELSGPSHHCLEDISLMRLLPNFIVFSPSDWKMAESFVDYSIKIKKPKYLRFDSGPLPLIYSKLTEFNYGKGFSELIKGKEICLLSTGFMTHTALKVAEEIKNIGVVDVFLLKPSREKLLAETIKKYKYVITLEEGFINNGGLDSLVSKIIREHDLNIKIKNLGIDDKYLFELGGRKHLHELNGLDPKSIIKLIKKLE